MEDGISDIDFCTPPDFLECLKSSVGIGENRWHTNTKTQKCKEKSVKFVFVLV
jgi:hypothetical protein